jgi:uncharacterized protein (DUF488 family)
MRLGLLDARGPPAWRFLTLRAMETSETVLFTIGHSTHPIADFLALLSLHKIVTLADIRSFPGSRRCPQFNQETLENSLKAAGIDYRWLKGLGGRRKGRPDSPHVAWTHPAFRSYADHMETDEFAQALDELAAFARNASCAIMCSEGLWWRCHRRMVADSLLLRGFRVLHIMPDGKLETHRLTEFATVDRGRLLYNLAREVKKRSSSKA